MKMHIVVIEDDRALLVATTRSLEKAGFKVSGMTAIGTLDALAELKADCFILG